MKFDLIVVGAGHAGSEAALAASRMGFSVLLLTLDLDTVGQMSCNPAVGGVGKGQLVREIDALGGMMGLWADRTALQFRALNRGRGPAACSPRVQSDRKAYQAAVRRTIEADGNITLRQGMACRLVLRGGRAAGVETREGPSYGASRVIITAGTFLGARLHLGEASFPGGRFGDESAVGLTASLEAAGLAAARFSTSTPPRLALDSLDLSRLEEQSGDPDPVPLSFRSRRLPPALANCYLGRLGPGTVRLVRENLHRSPLHTGEAGGAHPRYCPSLEGKVVKFPDRDGHNLFLEPESDGGREIYVNGFATALAPEIQEKALRSIPGLESAVVMRYGYSVDYDYFPPDRLKPTLESRVVPGLYLAGQVNGTSGYEEAAGQGLLAGINAALSLGDQPPFLPRRDEAYLGVLVSDLGRVRLTEPYRLFTSRAEYRLLLRFSNADFRLMDHGYRFGLVSGEDWERMRLERERVAAEIRRLGVERFVEPGGRSVRLADFLRRPGVGWRDLPAAPGAPGPGSRVALEVETAVKYEGYLEREREMARRVEDSGRLPLPPDFDYDSIPGLSGEAREKLRLRRPATLEEARLIDGLRASDLSLLYLRFR